MLAPDFVFSKATESIALNWRSDTHWDFLIQSEFSMHVMAHDLQTSHWHSKYLLYDCSVTRLGDCLHFGQPSKAGGNN